MIPATLAANNSLDRWVAVDPKGHVRILFGKVVPG